MGIDNPIHLVFLGAIALMVLGPKRLPEVARSLGKGIREFRESMEKMSGGLGEDHQNPPPPQPLPLATASVPQGAFGAQTPQAMPQAMPQAPSAMPQVPPEAMAQPTVGPQDHQAVAGDTGEAISRDTEQTVAGDTEQTVAGDTEEAISGVSLPIAESTVASNDPVDAVAHRQPVHSGYDSGQESNGTIFSIEDVSVVEDDPPSPDG